MTHWIDVDGTITITHTGVTITITAVTWRWRYWGHIRKCGCGYCRMEAEVIHHITKSGRNIKRTTAGGDAKSIIIMMVN